MVGQGASVDLLVEDLAADLEGRPYEVAKAGAGWMLHTRAAYGPAIRAAADAGGQALNLSELDLAVLVAIAWHQPIGREGMKDIFGREIGRDLIGRLAERDLIATGPREPRPAVRPTPSSPPRPSSPSSGFRTRPTLSVSKAIQGRSAGGSDRKTPPARQAVRY